MSTSTIILIVVFVVLAGAMVGLYFLGQKTQKKQAEQQEQLQAAAQFVSMLIIDKKRLRMKDAGLPDAVMAQTPWYAKNSKVPVVKAKVGPQIMNFMCDAAVFEEIPLKKEVKASVSGLYINSVKGLHGKTEVNTNKKKSWRARLKLKSDAASQTLREAQKEKEAAKAAKSKKK